MDLHKTQNRKSKIVKLMIYTANHFLLQDLSQGFSIMRIVKGDYRKDNFGDWQQPSKVDDVLNQTIT